jgi:hypothetical protein
MGYVRRNINNWCPWITSNVLLSCALIEPDIQMRKNIARKSMEVIDHFTLIYHEDGGCDEGPNYWTVAGASYFDCLEILYDLTGGQADEFDNPFIRSMGEYIAKVCINVDENYYINFADAGPRVKIHRNLVTRFGRRTKSQMLEKFGLSCPLPDSTTPMQWSLYRALKNHYEILPPKEFAKYPKKSWLNGVEIMIARESENDNTGFVFAMKGGHNRESHNHNDVGHFIVYDNGSPLIIDVGVGTYRADTFNENRYKIFTMRSSYHNLPTFNDVEEKNGFEYHSEDVHYDSDLNRLSMSLKSAYPSESRLEKFVRTGTLQDGKIKIVDDIELTEAGKVSFHLMVADLPEVIGKGMLRFTNGRVAEFDPSLEVTIESITLDDPAIIRSWNRETLYRIVLSKITQKGVFELTIR